MVNLPIVDLELQPHEIRQDGRGPRLCFYRWGADAGLGALYG